MLRRSQLERHKGFLGALASAKDTRLVRKFISEASHLQLRTVILLLASLILKKVPASDRVREAFARSRKKRTLKQNFSSWSKVKKLLANKEAWKDILLEVAPIISPASSAFINHGGS